MDKINRALTATEDNAVMIADLRATVKKLAGSAFEILTSTNSSLGVVNAPKGGAAIIAFDGNSVAVEFCGAQIGYGSSPVIASLPAGNGELKLAAARSDVRALILYKV